MKKISNVALVVFMLLAALSLHAQNLIGAWERLSGTDRHTRICSDKFFVVTLYNVDGKKFIGTFGGSYAMQGNTVVERQEFNTMHPELIGQEIKYETKIKDGKLTAAYKEGKEEWFKVDDGTPGKLAGAWLITGRRTGDQVTEITPGARKTMKILSGTRFQWIAYNSETKEFFGTGGGTYTTEGSTYTESILFFSRDSSRVGVDLSFEYALEDGKWRHKGLSSKGEPIDEVWTKREKLGL